jgi:hypothetical protein
MRIWIACFLLIFFSPLTASPVYYTFEGSITGFSVGITGTQEDPYKGQIYQYAVDHGLGIGTAVSYTVMVDRDIPGTVYAPEHNTLHTHLFHYETDDGAGNTHAYDSYHAELIDGNILGGWPKEHNYVFSEIRTGDYTFGSLDVYPYTIFKVGSYIEIQNAYTSNKLIDDLSVNDSFQFSNVYDGKPELPAYHMGYLYGSLTLASIASAYPISEPSPLILLTFGLLALASRSSRSPGDKTPLIGFSTAEKQFTQDFSAPQHMALTNT